MPKDELDKNTFLNLLKEFKNLPHAKQKLTFMEVSGYPHYENVCSNILAFYLDPMQEHGLNDLFVVAILRIFNRNCSTKVKIVNREYSTTSGRLDILVQGEEFTIAIENKIFHWLANDLDDYADSVANFNNKSENNIKIVLGLTDIKKPEMLRGGFVGCTYKRLWKEIEEILYLYRDKASPKWITYLLDFMETTNNLLGGSVEIKETDRFFIDHDEQILLLNKERDEFLKRLYKRIPVLFDLMKNIPEEIFLENKPFLYSVDRIVFNFKKYQNNIQLAFDLYLDPKGWSLVLFGRGPASSVYLQKVVRHPSLEGRMKNIEINDKRYFVKKWPLEEDLILIREDIFQWLHVVNGFNVVNENFISHESI